MIEVVLRAVRVDVGSSTPLLLLEEVGGNRVLPIFIGAPEATAIAYALQGIEAPRPMSHDLLGNVITALGAKLFSVEIVELVDNTFFASLRLLRGAEEISVSARPSDAVALALRVGAPLLVHDDLMNAEGQIYAADDEDDELSEDVDEDSLLADLRSFLDTVNPEDFDQ
jgi:bifunctional DNase/RNase